MDIKINKSEFSFMSSDNITQIHSLKWIPDTNNIKGIIQIAHGMGEHIQRYDDFANFLASNGYIVCGNDHLGHGKSVSSENKYGYFSKTNGWQNVIKDMHNLSNIIREEYKDLPYILIGHSMGSLLSREYTAIYGDELNGVVYCGTSAGSLFIDLIIKLCEKRIIEKGELEVGEDINKLVFGKYNRKAYPRNSRFDWLSRDVEEVNKYINDSLCGFTFTYSGFLDLFKLTKQVSGKQWASRIPLDLPIFIISGNMDPVGNYSHGVMKVADWLFTTSHRKVITKFYDDSRHELLNEIDKKLVYKDILKWIERINNEKSGK